MVGWLHCFYALAKKHGGRAHLMEVKKQSETGGKPELIVFFLFLILFLLE
jgi:hypothetical protein